MKIATSLSELATLTQPTIVTIGNFDGVHCGHRTVIAALRQRANERNALSVAVTFDPHPAHILRPNSHLPLITPLARKLDLLAATGLDLTLVLPFTDELRHWSARHFAATVLRDTLHAAEVHEGETFRFGFDAQADIASLSTLGTQLGFTVQTYQPRTMRGAAISSSRIRALITAGNMHESRTLLGRPFSIRSTPASGRGYGTRYAVPTINLAPYAELLPAHGVYITTLRVGNKETSRLFHGVTNIGNRPTFGADSFAIETHLLDFEPPYLQDQALSEETPLELTFLHRLRPERRFETPDLLRAQILRDVAKAQRYFALGKALRATSL